MTNEEIIKDLDVHDELLGYLDLVRKIMNKARQDEREKLTEEKIREYFAGLNNKETALIVLNYLLRGGIADDDLRGLRLQWIKDEREKMQGVDCFISWDGRDSGTVDAWHNDEPRKGENDMFYGSSDINGKHSHISELHKDFAKLLGISPGQCKKFRIVGINVSNQLTTEAT